MDSILLNLLSVFLNLHKKSKKKSFSLRVKSKFFVVVDLNLLSSI